jgi:transcriptional regulator
MYLPAHFDQSDPDVLHRLMRAHPLATLVTLGSDGLNANHVPLLLLPEPGPFGTLRGHVARANPVWRDLNADVAALAIFQGPQAYVSPNWYPTKKQTGKVVPTWNYVAVHASGRLRIVDDAAWIRALLQTLTTRHEAAQPHPWKMADAPDDYIETMVANVVGIEIEIQHLAGKVKASQNQPGVNRTAVVQALAGADMHESRDMAAWVLDPAGPPSTP